MTESAETSQDKNNKPTMLIAMGVAAVLGVYVLFFTGKSQQPVEQPPQDTLMMSIDKVSGKAQDEDSAAPGRTEGGGATSPTKSYDEDLMEGYLGGKRQAVTVETASGPVTYTPGRDGNPPDWVVNQYPEIEAATRAAMEEKQRAQQARDAEDPATAAQDEEAALRDLMARGDAEATYDLALLLRTDKQEYAESNKIMEQAARMGYVPAMTRLAQLLETGDSIAEDAAQAYAWQTVIAALTGDERAKQRRALVDRMSDSEAAAAHETARELISSLGPEAITTARSYQDPGQ